MEITFTSSADILRLNYPRGFSSEQHVDERQTVSSTKWGKMQLEECWFEGACLLCSRFSVEQRSALKLQCDSFCWVMNFVLKGEVSSNIIGEKMLLKEGRYQTFYCPSLHVDLHIGQDAEVFTICLTRWYISKLLGRELLPEQFPKDNGGRLTMVADNAYVHTQMSALVQEIIRARQAPYIRRVFLEAKILELLYLQLEELEKKQAPEQALSAEEIFRLQEAREMIAANLQTPCSLIELARRTGMNDFKLKRGFKVLFGTTVFGYLADLRMKTARRMLEEGKTVGEASTSVGYKNPQHFTAAFKKRYGILPSKLRPLKL